MTRPNGLEWRSMPRRARLFVAATIAVGTLALAANVPLHYQRPVLFAALLAASCLTSIWKITLPMPIGSGSTLSMSYAADLMALLVLGPRYAVVIAAAGVWTQCAYKVRHPYPVYRTLFSVAAEAITMATTGAMYQRLGGVVGSTTVAGVAQPVVGAVATYFVVNTALVATAIGLTTGRAVWKVWRDDFLWSGASFMVAGTAGAVAAIVINRGAAWEAVLLLAPVYLTYRTYLIFVGRLEDQLRHAAETRRLHRDTVDALAHAREVERALAAERQRLVAALADMARLEGAREQLLKREHEARANAEQANRLKDQFLATVSHELRTPLNAILGWADMLRHGMLESPRRDRAVHAIYDSAKRQAQLIDELLDVARIMAGKLQLERTPLDLNAVVHAAVEVVQPTADGKRVHIAVDTDVVESPYFGDPARLQQIVWNLLANAVKFTPEDGAVHVRVSRRDDATEVTVTDTGQGIPAAFLASVFEPFRQADGSTTRSHGGLGLGLAIVKQLVDAHGGTITAESAGEGRGSTFVVRLPPVAMRSMHVAPAVAADEAVDTGSLAGVSVLVVDDDDQSREVVTAYLEQSGARVVTASNARDAFDLLHRERIDVLLADIAMPAEDGYGLLHRVRASPASRVATTPSIALTAFARDEDRRRALDAGFQLHLVKPIDAHALVTAVASFGKLSPT